MKSLANDKRITDSKQQEDQKNISSQGYKKLQQLIETNIQCQSIICTLEKEAEKLQLENQKLQEQIQLKKIQLDNEQKEIEEQQSKNQVEGQSQINQWIVQAQNYSGVPQQVINSLVCLQYQGSAQDNEICLYCYQPIQLSAQCKYLPCYHLFHAECANNHLKVNKSCPACGEPVCKSSQ